MSSSFAGQWPRGFRMPLWSLMRLCAAIHTYGVRYNLTVKGIGADPRRQISFGFTRSTGGAHVAPTTLKICSPADQSVSPLLGINGGHRRRSRRNEGSFWHWAGRRGRVSVQKGHRARMAWPLSLCPMTRRTVFTVSTKMDGVMTLSLGCWRFPPLRLSEL